MREIFPGVRPPSIDFQAVQDGRRSRPFYVTIALDVSRSIANGLTDDLTDTSGKALVLNAAGNSMFSDPIYDAAGTYIAGVIVAHHQDSALGSGISTPITLLPNSAERIPFTQIVLENFAQAGKKARLIYGVDIDFVPGFNAQSTIAGIVQTREYGLSYGAGFVSTAALAAAVSQQVFAPASNVNGAIVWAADAVSIYGTAAVPASTLAAHTAAPNSITVGDVYTVGKFSESAAHISLALTLGGRPVFVPAGKGLYFTSSVLEVNGHRSVLYSLL